LTARSTHDAILDAVFGWQGAGPETRASLLHALCSGVRLQSIFTNSLTLLILSGIIIAQTRDPLHAVWVAAVILSGLMPRLYAARLHRQQEYSVDTEGKALGFLLISALYGLVWGTGPFLMLPELSGPGVGILLFMMVFGSIMGPYAAMPGIFYVRLATTGACTLVATALYTNMQIFLACLVISIWLGLRTDVWRSYHRTLRKQLELQQTLESRHAELQSTNRKRKAANEELRKLALTDPLTGAVNRRELMNRINTLDGPAGVLLFDIDHFKLINDSYGHATGDRVLVELVNLVQDNLRRQDLLARIGGEEFAVVLTGSDMTNAHGLAERLREQVEKHVIHAGNDAVRLTISIGIVTVAGGVTATGTELLNEADIALYRAKARGRNRIESVMRDNAGPE